MALTLITAPVEEPVTLYDASLHLRRDGSDDDEYIEALIPAARELIEQNTGRVFYDQTWKLVLRDFPYGYIRLPKSPLLEVMSVTYRAANGDYQTLQQDVDFYVDTASEPGTIDPGDGSWPTTGCYPDGVSIVFRSGYIDTASPTAGSEVPQRAKLAVLMLVSHWYENREPVNVGNLTTQLPLHVARMIQSLRVYGDA